MKTKKIMAILLASIISILTMTMNVVASNNITFSHRNDINEFASNIANVYIAKYPSEYIMINNIIGEIVNKDVFIECYESDGKAAFQIVEDSLRDALEPSVFALKNGKYYVSVPTVSQVCYHPKTGEELHYYCGPASALQALIGNGKLSNIAQNQNSQKVYDVGSEMGTDSSGTNISNLTSYMQKYYKSTSITYKTKAFTRFTYDKAIDFVKYSLQNGAPPVIRIDDTSVLDYYSSKEESLTHYVTISEVDTINNTVTLVDPNYELKYQGSHTITMDEFIKLVNINGWISVYTNVKTGSYVYE